MKRKVVELSQPAEQLSQNIASDIEKSLILYKSKDDDHLKKIADFEAKCKKADEDLKLKATTTLTDAQNQASAIVSLAQEKSASMADEVSAWEVEKEF